MRFFHRVSRRNVFALRSSQRNDLLPFAAPRHSAAIQDERVHAYRMAIFSHATIRIRKSEQRLLLASERQAKVSRPPSEFAAMRDIPYHEAVGSLMLGVPRRYCVLGDHTIPFHEELHIGKRSNAFSGT